MKYEILKLSIFGNPNIGVYIFVNNTIALVPPGLLKNEKEIISETLDVELIETKIAGTILNGILVAGNDNAIIFPRNVLDEELSLVKELVKKHDINVYISSSRNTAMGNIILTNNKAGIIGSEMEKEEIDTLSDVLGVEIFVKNILGLSIPGSLAVITDYGGVVHPDIEDKELSELEDILKIRLERATVNSGISFIKSGLIANNHSALVGETTTGPEILRIRRGLVPG